MPANTPLRVLAAPQAFKGSLSASEVARAMSEGVLRAAPDAQLTELPLADGGEGTVQALVDATGGRLIEVRATGPLGDHVQATYGILGDGETAVIEMAAASGLPLVPPARRNPLLTTTYGTGELIRHALEHGCRRLTIGIGGSATVDGGAGMAQALGVRLFDADGGDIGPGGGSLASLARIDATGLLPQAREATVLVACDVANPLLGPTGAAAVYGPQKGATPEMVQQLEAGLDNLARVVERDLGARVADLPGAGAAGGLGAGLVAFLNAELRPGIEIVMEAVGFEDRVRQADLVLTGEGRMDAQTAFGKTIAGVARVAAKHGVPVVALAGSVEPGAADALPGLVAALPILAGPMTLDEAMDPSTAKRLVAYAAEQAIRLIETRGASRPLLDG
jgi:glycerate kinase